MSRHFSKPCLLKARPSPPAPASLQCGALHGCTKGACYHRICWVTRDCNMMKGRSREECCQVMGARPHLSFRSANGLAAAFPGVLSASCRPATFASPLCPSFLIPCWLVSFWPCPKPSHCLHDCLAGAPADSTQFLPGCVVTQHDNILHSESKCKTDVCSSGVTQGM